MRIWIHGLIDMRFRAFGRSTFMDTERKRLILERKHQRERESLPLFSDQIAEAQPTADQVMQDRALRWEQIEQKQRAFRAQVWRRARQRFFAVPDIERKQLRDYWNNHRWFPGDAVHFSGFMDLYERGEIDLS